MSNYPLQYKLSWLPRLLFPAVPAGSRVGATAETLIAEPGPIVRIVFFGDMSAVANRIAPIIDPRLQALFASADLVVGNCESPIVSEPRFPLSTRLGLRHAMQADFVAATLTAASIAPERTVLSLANNHALDQGTDGFEETVSTLHRMGIRTVGTASHPTLAVEIGGVRLGFMGFTQWRNETARAFDGRVMTTDDMEADGWTVLGSPADLTCALPHWDWEFRETPRLETRRLAHRLASHGASLIVGGHAHIVQPVVHEAEIVTAYGLGDFLGTAWRHVCKPLRRGAVLGVDIGCHGPAKGKIARYEFLTFERILEGERERLVLG